MVDVVTNIMPRAPEPVGGMTMRVAVLGAGLMGHSLALVFALGGHQVRLTDSNLATLEKAGALMEGALATLREAGEADTAWTDERLRTVVTRVGSMADAVADAELIIEAVYESPEVKRAVFAEVDALAPMGAIIASNTSSTRHFPVRAGAAAGAHVDCALVLAALLGGSVRRGGQRAHRPGGGGDSAKRGRPPWARSRW